MNAQTFVTLRLAETEDRNRIYALRHEVYAEELGQQRVNVAHALSDALDESNIYIVAEADGELAGFISLTPPEASAFSIEKYLGRDEFPFPRAADLFEARLLTVRPRFR